MVILSSGEEVEASLTIKKIINGVASIVEINEDKLIVTEGTYIYYYTYNGETKTQSLIVNKYLNLTGIELLSLNEKLEDDSISEEEFIKLKETFNNTQLTIEENTINLNIIKKENNSNQIALLLKLETDYLDETKITIDNPNIILSKENNTWHQSLLQNEIVLWINYNEINESNEIKLNINGINYTFKLNITIKTETDSDKENESVTDDEEKTEDIEVEEDESEEELPPTTEPEIDSNEDITDSPINESVNIIDNNITIETNLSQ